MLINRRTMLGGAGVAALAGAGADHALPSLLPHNNTQEPDMTDDAARFGNPRIPAELNTAQPHMFHLGALPRTQFDGGTLRQAYEGNWPILMGQEASVVMVTLEPGGIREPHWHPSAWEINVITRGVATWTLLDPLGHSEHFEANVGDVVFAPQGSLHYFENKGTDELDLLIVFNASTEEGKDDIGIGASISKLPPDVLSAVFGVPAETFTKFKKIDQSLTIIKRQLS
ncbi:cupin domain-containing protein [Mycobacterium sp. CBMA293]|uniref:cupin domain-containing protein n=2 Tax=Mycolicibacterium TaxID=1866885 RepID=UPI0012DF753C|nr:MULTISPECIES: cupin domain-containing protein [unclassified Mycolicibacterium]MUL49366.1 cupin domain-containing protein [Mycolicibacterium sp. CBMA 360]MUL57729.1 cupin domain-containing protein [Mycolicibacterium sp. CBMA 335]MUL72822.1 cupin domain-containing protein [Mycolicibacterium sp. CBMA 311]MUL96772.1 cupin domain-containing protein [Mycolicibacterium sp. CBMA 230]MUM09455.1 cupin domain-containing protein [Mycolicibacterium sp. CBMA 293]